MVYNSDIKIGGMTSRKGIIIRRFNLSKICFEKIHEVFCATRIWQTGIQNTQVNLFGYIDLLRFSGMLCFLRLVFLTAHKNY